MVAVGSGLETRVVREKIDSVAASGAAELVSKPQASWLRGRIWGIEGGGAAGARPLERGAGRDCPSRAVAWPGPAWQAICEPGQSSIRTNTPNIFVDS